MHAVRVTVIAPELVRIEYAPAHPPDGRFVDHPSLFAIHGPMGTAPVDAPWRAMRTTSAGQGSSPIVVETGRFRLEYTPDGRPPHAGNMRVLIAHDRPPPDVPMEGGRVVWTPGARNVHNLGGTLSTLDGLRGPAPLGDGLLARDGWALVDDSETALLVNGWARARQHEGLEHNTDWYLFAYGSDYRAALRALATIAGGVPLPRRYALGSWFSRYWPYTSTEFRGIVDEYQTHGFPLDVMVLDMDWHREGWTGWSWNRELLPDAEELLSWLHEHQLAVTLNLHPADGVGSHEDRYAAFMHALGREPDGSRVPFDAGDRAYMTALFDEVHRPLERDDVSDAASPGADFWWLDWQQDQYTRSIPGLTNLRWLNHLYFQHTRRVRVSNERGDANEHSLRGLSFSRWAGWGDHRHPVHFSGDAHTGWPMLAFQVEMTARAGNVGCFYWSHDIGGHFGPRLEEATTRWVQFGALSPVLRLHSARTSVLDRRPWTYEPRFCDAMRGAFQLRSRLFPYIYTAAAQSSRDTVPLLRPMFLDFGDHPAAYQASHQYMLGDDLLVAPIVEPGIGERCIAARHVWFPPSTGGRGWFDLDTGERFEPGSEAFIAADIDHVPVFVPAGVPMPTRPVTMRMAGEPITELVVRCFPGQDGQVEERALREDDGVSLAHERGVAAHTPMIARWRREQNGEVVTLTLRIGPTVGSFAGQLDERAMTVEIGAVAEALDALVNGVAAAIEHAVDEQTGGGMGRVRVGAGSVRDPCEVRVRFREQDARLAAGHRMARDFADASGRQTTLAQLHAHVIEECRAGGVQAEPDRVARLLAIGAGIGAHVCDGTLRVVDPHRWIDGARIEGEIIDVYGRLETPVAAFASEPRARPGDPLVVPLPAQPMRPPALGQRATRIARFRFAMRGRPIVLEKIIETRWRALTEFRASHPFAWDWRKSITDQVFVPEFDPAAPLEHSTAAAVGDKWAIDFRNTFPGAAGLAYAACIVFSARAQSVKLHLDSSDKLEAWVNGEKVFSQDGFETHAAAKGFAEFMLRAGPNALLIKCSEGGGGWGFTANIEGEYAVTASADHQPASPSAG